jgi:hypothetical protein
MQRRWAEACGFEWVGRWLRDGAFAIDIPKWSTVNGASVASSAKKSGSQDQTVSHVMRKELTELAWLASIIALISIASVGLGVGLAVTIGLWPS